MKRTPLFSALAALLIALTSVSPSYGEVSSSVRETRVLATTFPVWLFARAVTKGAPGVHLDLMVPAASGCPHDYALTPQDALKLERADILVINGLGLDHFALDAPQKPSVIVDASDGAHELLAGESDIGGKWDPWAHEHHAVVEEPGEGWGVNPHIFASPRTAALMVRHIGSELARLDAANADIYRRNAQAFADELDALASEFSGLGAKLANNRLVTQHDAFDYLARDAGLDIVAVLEEHEGREPSAAVMLRLVREIKEHGAGAVFVEPLLPARAGEVVAREAGVPLAVLDPVTACLGQCGDMSALPQTYYQDAMRGNLRTLEQTLGVR